jgi:large subunit ribosomal protein L13e
MQFHCLQEAGIRRKEARSIGIAVDHRRRNQSNESLELNVQRLKAYKAKLIVFPRKAGKPKKGDSEAAEVAGAVQLRTALFPVEQAAPAVEARAITAEEKNVNAYMKLRYARSAKRSLGKREKRAREKAEEEANKKK